MKTSSSEDEGEENFTGRHLGRLYPPFTKILQVGKRSLSEKAIPHLHFMPFRSNIES